LWSYAALNDVNKLNATPRRAPNDPSLQLILPYELFYGIQPPTKHFLPFGQRGYVVQTGPKTKHAPRSTLALFLHAPNEHQYIILLMNGNISTCRPSEFTPVHIAAAQHAISAERAPPNSRACAESHEKSLKPHNDWAAAYDSDLDRNDKFGLWRYEFPRPDDTPCPAIIKFKTKLDANGRELKKKVRIAIRGDLMKPGEDFNQNKASSQTTSHTSLRIFLAVSAAGSLPIEFLDVPEAYPRAYSDPSCRQTMRQLPRSDGSLKHPGYVLVMQKEMTDAPNAGYSWGDHCEKDLVKFG
jgi:hypothetical protein